MFSRCMWKMRPGRVRFSKYACPGQPRGTRLAEEAFEESEEAAARNCSEGQRQVWARGWVGAGGPRIKTGGRTSHLLEYQRSFRGSAGVGGRGVWDGRSLRVARGWGGRWTPQGRLAAGERPPRPSARDTQYAQIDIRWGEADAHRCRGGPGGLGGWLMEPAAPHCSTTRKMREPRRWSIGIGVEEGKSMELNVFVKIEN